MQNIYYVYEHWQPGAASPFYVGKGKGDRAYDFDRPRNRKCRRIIAELAAAGLTVDVRIIAEGMTEDVAYQLEVARIAFWREQEGDALTNVKAGGDGFRDPTGEIARKISATVSRVNKGRVVSPETRAKIAETNRQTWADPERREQLSETLKEAWRRNPAPRPLSPEGRQRLVDAHTGRVPTEEDRAKRSVKLKGRVFSDETREKMRLAKLGKPQSPEHIAARAAGLKGHTVSDETRAKLSAANKGRSPVNKKAVTPKRVILKRPER